MKKFTITLLLVVVTTLSYSETKTTLEDYNYLTKGLKFQLDNGLGIKQGYNLKQIGQFNNSVEYCKIFAFYKESNPDEIIAALVTIETKDKVHYLCIPNENSDINIKQASYDLINTTLTKEQVTLIAFALAYIN